MVAVPRSSMYSYLMTRLTAADMVKKKKKTSLTGLSLLTRLTCLTRLTSPTCHDSLIPPKNEEINSVFKLV